VAKAETQEGEREAYAVGRSGELLVEQDEPDRPEEIERPENRPCDKERGQRPLRASRACGA
jgi:hypothetical protein